MTEPSPESGAIDTMPKGQWCPIGALNLHTFNHERTECIWCGPNRLAWADGRWVEQPNGTHAWSVVPTTSPATTVPEVYVVVDDDPERDPRGYSPCDGDEPSTSPGRA